VAATHGINVGDGVRVYECLHGGPRTAANEADPLPLLLPAIDLLEGVGQGEAARRIQHAVETVLTADGARTRDLGGQATTSEMTSALIAALPG
jgi:isocitrate dehydrogenase (NAD+)